MKLLINVLPLLFTRTGVANYAYHLSRQFLELYPDNEYTFYRGVLSGTLPDPAAAPDRENRPRAGVAASLISLMKKSPWVFALAAAAQKAVLSFSGRYDLYFEPNFVPLPGVRSSRVVTTVHDFAFHLDPAWGPRGGFELVMKNFWRSIQTSDAIITDSDFIKAQAIEFLKMDPDRIRPIPLGIDHETFKTQVTADRRGLPENFILFVGSIQPRKNLKRLLEAYLSLPPGFRKDRKLLLVGQSGWNNTEILNRIQKHREEIMLLNSVGDDAELARIYRAASVFIFPSLYEGFGLPPLEAMACGCPAVVSKIASLPEVCGDAAYYINPLDTHDIAEAIHRVSTDETLRTSLAQKGLARAGNFRWEDAAKRHMDLFRMLHG